MGHRADVTGLVRIIAVDTPRGRVARLRALLRGRHFWPPGTRPRREMHECVRMALREMRAPRGVEEVVDATQSRERSV